MPSPAVRLSEFSESVIRAMTRLANRPGAINLAQGFPLAPISKVIRSSAKQTWKSLGLRWSQAFLVGFQDFRHRRKSTGITSIRTFHVSAIMSLGPPTLSLLTSDGHHNCSWAAYFRRMMCQAAIVMPMRLSTTRTTNTTPILTVASIVWLVL